MIPVVQCIAVHLGGQVRIAVLGIYRGGLVDARDRSQGILPSFFYIVADGANDAKARNYTTIVDRDHNTPKKNSSKN